LPNPKPTLKFDSANEFKTGVMEDIAIGSTINVMEGWDIELAIA